MARLQQPLPLTKKSDEEKRGEEERGEDEDDSASCRPEPPLHKKFLERSSKGKSPSEENRSAKRRSHKKRPVAQKVEVSEVKRSRRAESIESMLMADNNISEFTCCRSFLFASRTFSLICLVMVLQQ